MAVADSQNKLTEGLELTLRGMSVGREQLPIIVLYRPERRVMRHREILRGVREGYHFRLRPFVQMHATAEAIGQLQRDQDVVRIYQDLPVHAYLNTALPRVQAPLVWNEGLSGENVRIAIVDTGVDAEHPDLVGRVVDAADFTGEGPQDVHGHGTHCAGIAAGTGAASQGLYRGVAPKASILAAKVLGADGQGMMSDVMAGVEWAVERGVQIISLSLGGSGPCDGTDALSEMCNAAMEAGTVVCVAAGNEGPGGYTVGSPGCADKVITIGASTDYDRIASFSSRGPTADGRVKPDLVTPGEDIVAARAHNTAMGEVINDYYVSASGTSMATPLAAGLCALLLQAEPQLTSAQVKARLMSTAVNLGDSAYAQGAGRADIWRAYANEVTQNPPPPPVAPPGPTPGLGCLATLLQVVVASARRRRS